jgi:hypothetical protein
MYFLAAPSQAEDIPEIDSTNLDALREAVGTTATVVGNVTSVGSTQAGNITFINIGLPMKQGFTAVIFRANYDAFPDGFDKYRNQKVAVTGLLELYRNEQVQIALREAGQIRILEE